MKRLAALLLAAVMLLGLPVYADTVIDHVLYTDIRAYINGVEISSFNIHNETAVVVEDLASYGFKVVWDGEARTLSVTRDASKAVVGMKTSSASVPAGGKIGDFAMDVYATDIKTYLDGKLTESYNVGGMTIVYVNDLAALYGESYVWDGDARTLSLTLSGAVSDQTVSSEPVKKSGYTVENGVYINKWAGISFRVKGEWIDDPEGMDESVFDLDDYFMMFGDALMVTAFTMVPDDEIKELFEAFSEEEIAALMAGSILDGSVAGAGDSVSTIKIGNNTWFDMDASDAVGVPARALFRVIGGKFFFLMAAAENMEDVEAFFSSVKPA